MNTKMFLKKISIVFLFFILVIRVSLHSEHFLSIVMPCFNCAQTVSESIDSIYQQNLKLPFEVVCTDDGSTDITLSILREYEKKYENFHVIVHRENLGGGAANNTCVAHAKGDLLFRLDSDNILVPNSLNSLIEYFDKTDCDGAAFQEMRFFVRNSLGEKITTGSWFYVPKDNICDLSHALTLGSANPLHSGNYLYTRDSFNRAGGYPQKRSGTDTHCFGLKQYMTGSKIAILPGTFYWHLSNPNGYWSSEEKTGRNQELIWQTFKEFEHLFDEKTKAYIRSVNTKEVDPWVACSKFTLKS